MELLARKLRILPLAALATLAASVPAVATPPSHAAAMKPPASVKVTTCRSNAWYSGREVTFRTKMWRLDTDPTDKLEVKVEIQRKLNEAKSYRRLKIDALAKPTTGKDATATIYQRSVTLREVESAARYRARTIFRWRDAVTGKTRHKRVIVSKHCQQRHGLPKLSVAKLETLPVETTAGSSTTEQTMVSHLVTVANNGNSEAVDVPVAISVDGMPPIISTIESVAPRETAQVMVVAPRCRVGATVSLDPFKTLSRLGGEMRQGVAALNC